MSDNFYDLYFELQKIYMLAADADAKSWQQHCHLICKKVYKLINEENN